MFVLDRQAGRLDGRWLPVGAALLAWQAIIRDDPQLPPLVAQPGLARAAYSSWQRLHDYCIPPESLDCGESLETDAFARWCRAYRRLLAERGWVDGAVAPAQVHPASALPGLELIGFDQLTPLQQALTERWVAAGVEIRREATAETPAVSVGRVACLDPVAEIEAAARWAAQRLHGRDDLRIAIVVSDLAQRRDEVRRIVDRVLTPESGLTGGAAPESRSFELAAARPLSEQPVVAAALDLLESFVRPPDLAAVSRLLRNPFVGGADSEGPARGRLDARLRRYESPGFTLAALERTAAERACPELATRLAAARSIVSKWPEKVLPSACTKTIFELVSALGWPGVAPGSAEHQAEQRWRSLVSELGACDEFTGRVGRAEALGLLREMAGQVLFEPQELRAPLLVIDAATCAGMRFDGLWVCGLDAARWPPPATPDPFLPRAEQRRRSLPRASAELAAREARQTLERLLASAPEVILSVPDTEDEAPVLPSPLLRGIASLADPPGWPSPPLAAALYGARPALESLVDANLPPLSAEEARRGGARLLELQAACPFRAQAEVRLGARALEEPAIGLDAAERGDLVHAALARLWEELRDQAALLQLDGDGVLAAVRRAVEAALAEARQGADPVLAQLLDLEAQWLEARVLEMVEADRARAPFVVEGVEQEGTASIGGLSLQMRLDRVDRLADGSLAVIDYKTGASAEVRAWLDERPRLPQLPAYLAALGPSNVGAVAFARLRSGDTGYVGIARDAECFLGLKVPGAKGGPKGFESWEQLLEAWARRLQVLAHEYESGDARLAPDPPRACQYCHLGMLCRIRETAPAAAGEEAGDE
jgi:probable DNA repair protein